MNLISFNDSVLLWFIIVPSIIALVLSVCMLILRKLRTLLFTIIALAAFIAGTSVFDAFVGRVVLLFSPWLGVLFLIIALSSSIREWEASSAAALGRSGAGQGECPNCSEIIPLDSKECSSCGALLEDNATGEIKAR